MSHTRSTDDLTGFGGSRPARPAARDRDTESIPGIYEGFRKGEATEVEKVRGWVSAVVFGGRFGLRDPQAVVQDVLVRLYQLVCSDRVRDPQAFQRYVHLVTKNDCLGALRRQRRKDRRETSTEHLPEALSVPPLDADRMSSAEREAALRYVLQRLPEACRELWLLVYHEKLTSAEVGKRLGERSGTVRVRAHRCLEKARSIYRHYAAAPSPPAGGER